MYEIFSMSCAEYVYQFEFVLLCCWKWIVKSKILVVGSYISQGMLEGNSKLEFGFDNIYPCVAYPMISRTITDFDTFCVLSICTCLTVLSFQTLFYKFQMLWTNLKKLTQRQWRRPSNICPPHILYGLDWP